jgi:hypothetical protein
MVSAISNSSQVEPVSKSTGTSTQKPTQSEPPSATSKDSVQLSAAAQAALAALQEAIETPAQTANEASHGDLQAQRLLAREAVEKSASK